MPVKDSHLWLWALSAAVLMQSLAAFLTRVFPVMGPPLTDAARIPPESIGYLAAFNSLGSIWYLMSAGDLLPRLGPLRAMQLGTVIGALGVLLALTGNWWALVAGSVLIGFGYGPTPTAGAEVLNRYAPARHRSLVFSVKQSGVPLGGALAGVFIPPVLEAFGWQGACIVSALLVVAITVAIQPLRAPLDRDRDVAREVRWAALLDPTMLRTPFRTLAGRRALIMATLASVCFAIVQGCVLAFFVTFLTLPIGFTLAYAGAAFAVMQATGVVGRVIAGWAADRVHSPRLVLMALGVVSCGAIACLAGFAPSWPAWALYAIAAVAGAASTGWNGVFLAEVAELAPTGRVGEMTAAATFFTFAGYVVGPAAFGALIAQGISYALAFAMLAAVPLGGVLALSMAGGRR